MSSPAHFLSIFNTPTRQLTAILDRAVDLRRNPRPGLLEGKTLCCLFEKPSLRTRVSFEQAMRRLGGAAMSMGSHEVGLGGREAPEDVARVLSGMVDAIMARVMSHETLERLAGASSVPVINGLSDLAHPAQALADILTLIDEFSPAPGSAADLQGRTVAFVGDGNNVAASLAVACVKLGMTFNICSPEGYELHGTWLERVRASARAWTSETGRRSGEIRLCGDPVQAVLHADAVYCDTFVSMGQEHEHAERLRAFARYQVNAELLSQAPARAIVMHCLPAHRGVEITADMMDGPRSRVFRQAHNRLDAQMGLLATLLG